MSTLRRFLQRLVAFFRTGRAESELRREIGSHLALLEDTFRSQGMTAREARDAARRAFGGVEQIKEHQRATRSFGSIDAWWLDVKLGARMLVKYPGLTLIGGLGMAVAIAIAVGGYTVIRTILDPDLRLEEGERIVVLQHWDAARNTRDRRLLHDFASWRHDVTSIRDLGAYRTVGRNLIAPGGQPETVRIAEMTASGFRLARVGPLLGRYLTDADERAGAPPVLVIGHQVWRNRFSGDPAIVGRTVQLGEGAYTVVGVMPEGFAFPLNHAFWIPLQVDAVRHQPRTGPDLTVFGRIAPGLSQEAAQAELTAIGQRMAVAYPATHAQLRPQVIRYSRPFFDMDEPGNPAVMRIMQVLIALLLVVVSVNVAILVYARTATRHGEIAVRTALGASRRRVIGQLFIEALVLSIAAAVVGLGLAVSALDRLNIAIREIAGGQVPFWMDFALSPDAIAYAIALAVIGAAIVGVVPALKVTGRRVQTGLQGLAAGGGARMRLGRTWTALIVAQVGFAVALLPPAVFHAWDAMRTGTADPGFAAEEFLTASLVLDTPGVRAVDRTNPEFTSRYATRSEELLRRLRSESAISDVTFAAYIPGTEGTVWVEAEGLPLPAGAQAELSGHAVRSGRFGHEARFNRVDPGYFDAFGVRVLAGRPLTAADAGKQTIVVNRSFADLIFGDGNILGRRVRYVGTSGDARSDLVRMEQWYEIVGVVPDFPVKSTTSGLVDAKLYHAASAGAIYPMHVALRVRGAAAASFAGRLREVSAAVDPNLQLRNVSTIGHVLRQDQGMLRLVAIGLAVLTLSVVLLSSAGIYAMMSFTVSQRRKEIGIRAALGANPRRILGSIFSRALAQLAIGAVLGVLAAIMLDTATGGDLMEGNAHVVLPVVAVVMMLIGVMAALGPARRGLRIDPTEALRAE